MLVLTQAVPDRIGHGTFMHHSDAASEDIVKLVKDLKVPLGELKYFNNYSIACS